MRISRSDRRALTLILVVITTAICAVVLDRIFLQTNDAPFTLDQLAAADSLDQQLTLTTPNFPSSSGSVVGGFPADSPPSPPAPATFPFDPNTADSTALLRLGLAPWQVRAMYNYRAKGGRYHRPEDFKRVPGMTPELYERLAPHITIARRFRLYSDLEKEARTDDSQMKPKAERTPDTITSSDSPTGSSSTPRYQEKFRNPVVLDLNTVDTATLKKVPGIGSYRARRIVEYRDRLGGYADVEQLSDIEGLPEELKAWFAVKTPIFAPININTADQRQLALHPYISYAQARAITAYRKAYGRINSIDELSLSGTFTDADIARLKPYIQY